MLIFETSIKEDNANFPKSKMYTKKNKAHILKYKCFFLDNLTEGWNEGQSEKRGQC